jgi:adenine-specific DNA-methyltransferase
MEQHVLTGASLEPGQKNRRQSIKPSISAPSNSGTLLERAETNRRNVSPNIEQKKKSKLGQFMTPAPVARFMAGMFPKSKQHECRLLDAGAGLGALTCAFLDRWRGGGFAFNHVETTSFEIDDILREHLVATLQHYAEDGRIKTNVVAGDFILKTVLAMAEGCAPRIYTHAILNPPYKKINAGSDHRRALSQVGIETVNLYAAFVALVIEQMALGGTIVAILPRSFCNGTYYRPFREHLLSKCALRVMHLFGSRSKAFSDDDVLQENIIIMLERDGVQGAVTVTTSTDDTFSDLQTYSHEFDRIVLAGDAESFIHVPTSAGHTELEQLSFVRHALVDLGLKVSTGPVVDFRLKDHLRQAPEAGSVPILYPMHFAGKAVTWPVPEGKKANAIMVNDNTMGWLMPNGFYCVVRRFSSKEERRRIVANVIRPNDFPSETEFLGLENHVNVFNEKRHGLPEDLAYGMAAYMNTTAVDEAFRRFSGHTQVNAGDLKTMRYPSRGGLEKLGRWYKTHMDATQRELDEQLKQLAT